MAQCVATHGLADSDPADRFFDGSLEHRFVQMMAAALTRDLILINACCGEDPLPAQLS